MATKPKQTTTMPRNSTKSRRPAPRATKRSTAPAQQRTKTAAQSGLGKDERRAELVRMALNELMPLASVKPSPLYPARHATLYVDKVALIDAILVKEFGTA